MLCADFLKRYSDFRDGQFSDRRWRDEMEQHLRECAACRRFHAAIREGVAVLRSQRPLEPTPAFRRQLRARLAAAAHAVEPPGAWTPGALAVATLVLVAAALLIYEGLLAPRRPSIARSRAPVPVVVVNPSAPFVSFAAVGPGQSGPAPRWAAEREAIEP